MKRKNYLRIVIFGVVAMTLGYFIAVVSDTGLSAAPYFTESDTAAEHSKFNAVYNKVNPAVVNISTERIVKYRANDPFYDMFRDFFGDKSERPFRENKEKSIGSGFIISKEGYIVTNNHVVQRAESIIVKLSDGKSYEAEVVGTDAETDVAVIRIDAKEELFPVKLADSDKVEVGDWAIAIGNPYGLERTLTVGIISATGRDMGATKYDNFLQTDAAINPGNSGGPLLNINGEVVGINTMILSGQAQNLGFAVPINMAKDVIIQLIEDGSVKRQYLGVTVQPLNEQIKEDLDLKLDKGLLVIEVTKDSPAEKAGIKVDDIITEIDGVKIESFEQFARAIAFSKNGSKVTLDVLRNGKKQIIVAKLDYQTEKAVSKASALGMTLKDGDEGVLVVSIERNSPVYGALQENDTIVSLNRNRIRNVEDFNEVMKKLEKKDRLYFTVIRDGRQRMIVVQR